MFVAYRTTVGNIEFVVNLREHHDCIDIEIGPVNVVPNPGSLSATVSKSDTLEQFLDHYTQFILEAVSNVTDSLNHLGCELLAPEIVRPESCEKCAYWGNPTDTADKRVCRYWDIPERECFTGPHEHCSQGYVNKTDVIDAEDVESPVLKKTYVSTAPDPKHSYFNKYLADLYGARTLKDDLNVYTTLLNKWKELLPELLDKSKEK